MSSTFLAATLSVSFVLTMVLLLLLLPRLVNAGLQQRDVHKAGKPLIPELGGLAVLVVCSALILLSIQAYPRVMPVIAYVVLGLGLIGLLDDVIGMRQLVKAAAPMLAVIPLATILLNTQVLLPFVGQVEMGWLYLLLVAGTITIAPNAINMMGGFNGTEAGMGIVVAVSLAVIAYLTGEILALVLLVILAGSLLAILFFNWCPARVFLGDVGSFTVGAVIAVAVIVGHLEVAGAILLIPFVVDLVLKLPYRLPKTFARLESDGKLYCPQDAPVGLAQLVLKVCGGVSEGRLALRLMVIESVFGGIAILVYVLGGTV